MIEKLKTSKSSNDSKESLGVKLSQMRNKLNEIIDFINSKEYSKEYNNVIKNVVDDLIDNVKESE